MSIPTKPGLQVTFKMGYIGVEGKKFQNFFSLARTGK